jgi:hypothetical protein
MPTPIGPSVNVLFQHPGSLGVVAETDGRARLFVSADGRSFADRTPSGSWKAFYSAFFLGVADGWVFASRTAEDSFDLVLLKTTDGGRTWLPTPRHFSLDMHGGSYLVADFIDSDHGWISVADPTAPFAMLYRTTDGGETWTQIGSLDRRGGYAAMPDIGAVHFFDRDTAILSAFYNGEVFVSRDGAASWTAASIPWPKGVTPDETHPSDPIVLDGQTAVIPVRVSGPSAQLAYAITFDAGRTWRVRMLPLTNHYEATSSEGVVPIVADGAVVSPTVWWTITNTDAVSVTTGGLASGSSSWVTGVALQRQPDNAPPIWAWSATVGWVVVTFSGPVNSFERLYETTDGGRQWTAADPALAR